MSDRASASWPATSFSLSGLLELLAGVALFLALVTQLDYVGMLMAFSGFVVIAGMHCVVFWSSKTLVNIWRCFISLLFALVLFALAPRIAANLSPAASYRYGWFAIWVLLAVEIAFVSLAVIRRVRIGRRMRGEVPHG